MTDKKEKRSPGDICLTKSETFITFEEADFFEVDEGLYQIKVVMEHRAWECPFCGKSQQYHLINGSVVDGNGGSSMIVNGKNSDGCYECKDKQNEWHYSI